MYNYTHYNCIPEGVTYEAKEVVDDDDGKKEDVEGGEERESGVGGQDN